MDDRPFFIREPKWQLVFLVIFGFIVYMILNARLGGVDKNSVAIAFDLLILLVSRELTNYIASLTLSEFLAQVDLPDQPSAQAQTIAFRSRPQLTQRFFEAEFRQMAANSGLQLNWIDVGTWVAPAFLIPAKYLDAWKINVENQIRQQNIALLERETRLEEMLRLVRECR
jgi:hypothetical protein